MECWETITHRRNCWSVSWRFKASASALTMQKSHKLSTTSAGHCRGCWEFVRLLDGQRWGPSHRKGLAGASFEDRRAALRHWPLVSAEVLLFYPEVAVAFNNLASAHGSLGDYRTKKDLLGRALRIFIGHFGPDHPHVAIVQQNLDAVSSHCWNPWVRFQEVCTWFP